MYIDDLIFHLLFLRFFRWWKMKPASLANHSLSLRTWKVLVSFLRLILLLPSHLRKAFFMFFLNSEDNYITAKTWNESQFSLCALSSIPDLSFQKVDEIDYSANKELRKLQFFGPGPKAAVPAVKSEWKGWWFWTKNVVTIGSRFSGLHCNDAGVWIVYLSW